ncbi:DUF6933 domain-containing protein [Saccharopolyspora sp. 5N708]
MRISTPVAGKASTEDFYAHLIWVQRRKCLLLTHAGTLFSPFVPDATVAELRPVGPFVVSAIEGTLRSEGLPPDALARQNVTVGKTAELRVVGTMNDLAGITDACHRHRRWAGPL